MTQLSVSLVSFVSRFRESLDWAGRQRVDAVEIDARRQLTANEVGQTARRQIRHLLAERSMRCSGLLFPVRGSIADVNRLGDRIDAASEAMQLAYDLGARKLVVPFHPPTDDLERERTLDVLTTLVERGDRCGCQLLLRVGGGAEAVAILLESSPTLSVVGVQFDPAASSVAGQKIDTEVQRLAPFIRQIRMIDALRSSSGLGRETALGRGEVDFDMLAAVAAQLPIDAVVVSPDDVQIASLENGIEFTRAVFEHSFRQ